MAGLMSVDGLMSGIDTSSFVDGMMELARRPVRLLEAKQEKYQRQMVAFQSLNASLLVLKQQAYSMSTPTSLSNRTATSSDEDILAATASSSAARGTYSVTVNAIAQAHQIASQSFADLDTTSIGTGEFSITIGQGEDAVTTSVTIDSSNDTLAGLRDEINDSSADVTAFIVNTGDAATPYQLVIGSNQSGIENSMWITHTLTGGTAPDFYTASSSTGAPDTTGFTTTTTTPTMGGAYTGSQDKTYTFSFNMDGTIGSTAGLKLLWDDGEGNSGELDVGDTYTADDALAVAEGVTVALSAGDATNGDSFTVDMTAADLRETQVAQDASVSIGNTVGGGTPITVTNATNSVTGMIPGVTLDLASADASTSVTVTVDHDRAYVISQINSFVAAYNSTADLVSQYTMYDPASDTAGILLGNSAVMRVESDLTSTVSSSVAGLPAGFGALSTIGVEFSETGHLVVDSTELNEALEENFDAVANLFRLAGESTEPKVAFLSASDDTVPTVDGYDVDITQAATRGYLTAGSITDPAATPLVLDSSNNELRISVNDNISEVLTLTAGTYTSGSALAAEIQSRINGSEDLGALEVSVTWVDEGATGHFVIESQTYGSPSTVAIGAAPANSAHAALGLDSSVATDGQDVAGTINGEAATGIGQILTGDSSNSTTAGLRLMVTLSAGDLGAGAEAVVTITEGVAALLDDELASLTNSVDGLLTQRSDAMQDEIDRIAEDIESYEARLETRRERMLAEFAAMETAIAELNSQAEYVNQTLANVQWSSSKKD